MAVQELNDTFVTSDIILPQTGWEYYLARWISHIGSPPVLFVGMTMLTASLTAEKVWGSTAVYLTLALIIPIAYIIYLVQQGKATDYDVSVRQQRIIPMFVTLGGAAAGWLYFLIVAAPQLLLLVASANLLISLIVAIVTLEWKISVHSATNAAVATLVLAVTGSPVFFLSIPLIIWSRVRLRRHTLRQTIAGTLLGSMVVAALFLIFAV
jgi:membrane-associated phospholipid phosphatase